MSLLHSKDRVEDIRGKGTEEEKTKRVENIKTEGSKEEKGGGGPRMVVRGQ